MISIIAAITKNHVIGHGGTMPWHIPEDLKRTKRITMGHPLIMGRKTYEAVLAFKSTKNIPDRLLVGRTSIVLTRQTDFKVGKNDFVVTTLPSALEIAKRQEGSEEIFIFGGAELYSQTIDIADKLYLTIIDIEITGDTFFPQFSDSNFIIKSSIPSSINTESGKLPYTFVEFERIKRLQTTTA